MALNINEHSTLFQLCEAQHNWKNGFESKNIKPLKIEEKENGVLVTTLRPNTLSVKVVDGITNTVIPNIEIEANGKKLNTNQEGTAEYKNVREKVHLVVNPGDGYEITEKDIEKQTAVEVKACPDPASFYKRIEQAELHDQHPIKYALLVPSDQQVIPYDLYLATCQDSENRNEKEGWSIVEIKTGDVFILPTWVNPDDGQEYRNIAEVQVTYVYGGPWGTHTDNFALHLIKWDDGVWRWFANREYFLK